MALVIALMVVMVLIALAGWLTEVGVQSLALATADTYSEASQYAAQAAVAAARYQLRKNPHWEGQPGTWAARFGELSVPISYGQTQYSLYIQNQVGKGPTNILGVTVPANGVYLLATGATSSGKYPRQVAVLLSTVDGRAMPLMSGRR